MSIKAAAFAVAISLYGSVSASAGELPKPTGPVVLTVSGKIKNTNGDGVARFDRAMLDKLPQRKTVTKTPWHEGQKAFEGPLGSAVLEAVGAEGTNLHILALNDYASDVPAGDLTKYPVVLATKIDGRDISVREKGPIFMMYPFDSNPDLYNEQIFARCVWQVKSIAVQ